MLITEGTKLAICLGEKNVQCPFINHGCAKGSRHEKKFEPDLLESYLQEKRGRRHKRGSKGAWIECKAKSEEWHDCVGCCPYEARA